MAFTAVSSSSALVWTVSVHRHPFHQSFDGSVTRLLPFVRPVSFLVQTPFCQTLLVMALLRNPQRMSRLLLVQLEPSFCLHCHRNLSSWSVISHSENDPSDSTHRTTIVRVHTSFVELLRRNRDLANLVLLHVLSVSLGHPCLERLRPRLAFPPCTLASSLSCLAGLYRPDALALLCDAQPTATISSCAQCPLLSWNFSLLPESASLRTFWFSSRSPTNSVDQTAALRSSQT